MRAAFVRWGLAVLVVFGVLAPVRPASALDGPNITVGDVTITEGDSGVAAVTIPVDLSAPSMSVVTVYYTVVDGSAESGSDFAGKTGKLTFRLGATEKLISVSVFGDTSLEGNQNAEVRLTAAVNAHIEDGVGELVIRDDENNVTSSNAVSIGDATVI